MTEYQDKTIICRDCGQEFTFTSGEQNFYAQKGFESDPVRCSTCRQIKKQNRENYERTQY